MKKASRIVAVAVLIGTLGRQAAADLWQTDFAKASAAAKDANRYMLLDFSGSDWCGWCMKLDKEVFSQDVFRKYAEENLVCVLLDFPRGHELKKSIAQQNEAMKQQYKVRGFPTVLILSPGGDLVQTTGYQSGGAERYVEYLKSCIDPHRQKNNVPPSVALKEKTGPRASSERPSLRTNQEAAN